ncbi:dTDP-4-dehydrorhamnose reductase [Frankia sp. AiPa1]|uniref:dTDP-4-dehydrorhamnose reductase n=1 Tax=Frankia sp. AiPa1 TaxID=573492 RepID=UPI00202B6CAE|nr:dTDP-4-dehydrorhamnose reductase [Frankia sp. AiPa1]MCL9757694.1 dTDP-4-dehydrorhamnose reductase [Frankia sp. AiPa1]
MRVLVTGAAGQLGADLCRLLEARMADPASAVRAYAGLHRAELDISDPARVRAVLRDQARPAKVQGGLVVINTAAWTDVDGAEVDESAAYAVNATGAAHLAAACADVDAILVQVSTDYVFDGTAGKPYEVDDETGPAGAYGRTKLAGEDAVRTLLPASSYVVRTAWVYGQTGRNFVKTISRLARERGAVSVVDDQTGSPTWSADLAAGLLDLVAAAPPPGIYHCTNSGETTWFGFARAIMAEIGLDPQVVSPITTAAFPRPAARPAYSVLSSRSWLDAGLAPLRSWSEALSAAFATAGTDLRGD